jgi:hypothetical protein
VRCIFERALCENTDVDSLMNTDTTRTHLWRWVVVRFVFERALRDDVDVDSLIHTDTTRTLVRRIR